MIVVSLKLCSAPYFVNYLQLINSLICAMQHFNSYNTKEKNNKHQISTMSIPQILSALSQSRQWDQQLEYLQSLPINEQTAKHLNNSKNSTIILDLLGNPRSKVITSTCLFIIQMIDKYGVFMHPFINFFIANQVGFKLLGAGNKVVAQEVNELFKTAVLNYPNNKMYNAFAREMGSKNCQIRQFVSSYIVVLSDSVEFPQTLVQSLNTWKADASKIVRQNMRKIEDIISVKGTQKKVKANKQNNIPKQDFKLSKPVPQTSQLIIQSFMSAEQSLVQEQDLSSNIDFLLSKINNNETWSMKQYALGELCSIFDKCDLEPKDVLKFIKAFYSLLDEKRSKVNVIMCLMFTKAVLAYEPIVKKFLQQNFAQFVEKALRVEQEGIELVSKIINLDPHKYLMQLCQSTIDIKSIKQKVVALDLLVQKICGFEISPNKIAVFVKLLCKHFEKHHTHKQVYLPSLAIISHFKVHYPSQLLSCLLCLDKQTLTRIIELAQSVDPQLREAVVHYIHTMKNNSEKSQKKQETTENFTFKNSKLQHLLTQIQNEEQNSVTKLVQYIFHTKQSVTTRQFYQIIKLTQKVTTKNTLLQLQLLLQQICKSHNQNFLQGLFQAIASCDGSTIQSQYILGYLRKVCVLFQSCSWMMHYRHAEKLISIYRFSKCPKIRLLSIKILAFFPQELSSAYINAKQKKLIQSQQKLQMQ